MFSRFSQVFLRTNLFSGFRSGFLTASPPLFGLSSTGDAVIGVEVPRGEEPRAPGEDVLWVTEVLPMLLSEAAERRDAKDRFFLSPFGLWRVKIDDGRSVLEVAEELRGDKGRTAVLPEVFTESDIFLGRPCSF